MTAMPPRILIVGTSLLLAGLESLLKRQPGITLMSIKDHQPTVVEIELFQPSAIIFERESKLEMDITRYMASHPDLLMIGLDPSDERAVVWSGTIHQLATSEDVTELILAKIENS